MNPNTVLWVYIVLLIVGGLIGYFKANSKPSLIASVASAVALVLANVGFILAPNMVDVILAILLVIFTIRLTKTKKFMPSGLMLVLTIATLALRHIHI